MAEGTEQTTRERYREGLRMSHPPDPLKLAEEKRLLVELEDRGWLERTTAYLRFAGPGYLQSALTLGGGTAASSLFAGAAFGYDLLWVAPVAMLLGLVMLSAVAYQTLSTGMRPFDAMRRFAGAPFAWGWALGALFSSIIWHFPQYSLASAVLVDMSDVFGFSSMSRGAAGVVVLVWAVALSMLYGTTPRMIRWYERILKYMVWSVVLCFGLVVMKTGVSDPGALLKGFLAFRIPGERSGIVGATVVLSGLSAAVGVNMLFLYPYSLLARGWGREHRRLARFDLFLGMFVPYMLATSLMVIATANTLHTGDFQGKSLSPVEAAGVLAGLVGPTLGRVVFNLGILGMALSSITLQMLCAGFVCVELFGWPVGGKRYHLATLLPVPGVLGAVFWDDILVWVAVPTNILCGFLLPAAYVGFILLQRDRRYLGDDTPRGLRGSSWLGAMIVTTTILVVFLVWFAWTRGPSYLEQIL